MQASDSRNISSADDDEPDDWDKRIIKTGCADENFKLQICHADTGDWRKCAAEMKAFRDCWARNQNDQRTQTVQEESEK